MRRWSLSAVLAAGLTVVPVAADTLIVARLETPGQSIQLSNQGQKAAPPKKESRIWLGDGKARFDELRKSVILRRDLGKVYYVDHSRRIYVEAKLPPRIEDVVPESLAQRIARGDLEALAAIDFRPSDEKRVIGKWNCRRLDLTLEGGGLSIERTVWLTNDIQVDRALFSDLLRAAAVAEPLAGRILDKIAELGGVPVSEQSKVLVAGRTLTTLREVTGVRQVTPEPDTYEPPSGYQSQPFLYRVPREIGLR